MAAVGQSKGKLKADKAKEEEEAFQQRVRNQREKKEEEDIKKRKEKEEEDRKKRKEKEEDRKRKIEKEKQREEKLKAAQAKAEEAFQQRVRNQKEKKEEEDKNEEIEEERQAIIEEKKEKFEEKKKEILAAKTIEIGTKKWIVGLLRENWGEASSGAVFKMGNVKKSDSLASMLFSMKEEKIIRYPGITLRDDDYSKDKIITLIKLDYDPDKELEVFTKVLETMKIEPIEAI